MSITPNDLYYLGSIKRRLTEFKEALVDTAQFSLSGQAFADEIDWLDCFIEKHSRAFTDGENKQPQGN